MKLTVVVIGLILFICGCDNSNHKLMSEFPNVKDIKGVRIYSPNNGCDVFLEIDHVYPIETMDMGITNLNIEFVRGDFKWKEPEGK